MSVMKTPLFLDEAPGVCGAIADAFTATRIPTGESFFEGYPILTAGARIHYMPNVAVVFVGGSPAFRVNLTGARILEQLDGTHTAREIAQWLGQVYGDAPGRVRTLLPGFLSAAAFRGVARISAVPAPAPPAISGSREWPAPYSASLELTAACDLRCSHCYANGGRMPPDELSTAEWIQILEKLAAGCVKAGLTGGDPLIRPDFWIILERAAALGLLVKVYTNGMRVTPHVAGRLAQAGVDSVQVSLDGPDAASHDALRQSPGSFAAAVRAIQELRCAGVAVSAGMVVTASSVSLVPATVRLAADLGVRTFYVGRVMDRGRARERGMALTPEQRQVFLDSLDRAFGVAGETGVALVPEDSLLWALPLPKQGARRLVTDQIAVRDTMSRAAGPNCGAGRFTVFVSSQGHVRPCPVCDVVLGVARSGEELAAVLASETTQIFGSMEAPGSSLCSGCPNLYRCVGCPAEAFEYGRSTPGCRWSQQVLKGGGTPYDRFRTREGAAPSV